MSDTHTYNEELVQIKSLLIVTALHEREDIIARESVESFPNELLWEPFRDLLIDPDVWHYAVILQKLDPKVVFCHPDVLLDRPITSLYYRGLSGLSIKAAKAQVGSIESLEAGNPRARLTREKAFTMARLYNSSTCSVVKNSPDWTLEDGYRTIIATMGITLDGKMRNTIGQIAEDRIRTVILEWLLDRALIVQPTITKEQVYQQIPTICTLQEDIVMRYGSDPDISFGRNSDLLAIVEIKGGTDPAGALERYGAATKSFQNAVNTSPQCKNFYLGAIFTSELNRRIGADRLVEKTFNIIEILRNPEERDRFLTELFHHALRLI